MRRRRRRRRRRRPLVVPSPSLPSHSLASGTPVGKRSGAAAAAAPPRGGGGGSSIAPAGRALEASGWRVPLATRLRRHRCRRRFSHLLSRQMPPSAPPAAAAAASASSSPPHGARWCVRLACSLSHSLATRRSCWAWWRTSSLRRSVSRSCRMTILFCHTSEPKLSASSSSRRCCSSPAINRSTRARLKPPPPPPPTPTPTPTPPAASRSATTTRRRSGVHASYHHAARRSVTRVTCCGGVNGLGSKSVRRLIASASRLPGATPPRRPAAATALSAAAAAAGRSAAAAAGGGDDTNRGRGGSMRE